MDNGINQSLQYIIRVTFSKPFALNQRFFKNLLKGSCSVLLHIFFSLFFLNKIFLKDLN